MVVLVRRVLTASVIVYEQTISSINKGLLIYIGISKEDTQKECEYYAKKITNLRVFETDNKEISIKDINGEILSVSQFTLLANSKKGNRPTYSDAMKAQDAVSLFHYFNQCLNQESGLEIQTGVFGADMTILSVDDGPFTILLS